MSLTAAKQDLLHRKAERAAIEKLFEDFNAEGGRGVAVEAPVSIDYQDLLPKAVLDGQHHGAFLWPKDWAETINSDAQWSIQMAHCVNALPPAAWRRPREAEIALNESFGWVSTVDGFIPRVLTLSEVMALKAASGKTPKSEMSWIEKMENALYNAWRDWALDSLDGGRSSLRSRAWTDIRNSAANRKAREARTPTAEPAKEVEEVDTTQSNETALDLQSTLDEQVAQGKQFDEKATELAGQINEEEMAIAKMQLENANSEKEIEDAKSDLSRIRDTIGVLEERRRQLEEELATVFGERDKAENRIAGQRSHIKSNDKAKNASELRLAELRPLHTQAMEDSALAKQKILATQREMDIQSLEDQEAAAVARKDYLEAARIHAELKKIQGDFDEAEVVTPPAVQSEDTSNRSASDDDYDDDDYDGDELELEERSSNGVTYYVCTQTNDIFDLESGDTIGVWDFVSGGPQLI